MLYENIEQTYCERIQTNIAHIDGTSAVGEWIFSNTNIAITMTLVKREGRLSENGNFRDCVPKTIVTKRTAMCFKLPATIGIFGNTRVKVESDRFN